MRNASGRQNNLPPQCNGSLSGEQELPLTFHAPTLWLAMEYQLYGCALAPLRLEGDGFLADAHAEEIRVVGVMEHLVSRGRQQPAFHRCRSRRNRIKEKGIVADVQILKAMLSRLGVVP